MLKGIIGGLGGMIDIAPFILMLEEQGRERERERYTCLCGRTETERKRE